MGIITVWYYCIISPTFIESQNGAQIISLAVYVKRISKHWLYWHRKYLLHDISMTWAIIILTFIFTVEFHYFPFFFVWVVKPWNVSTHTWSDKHGCVTGCLKVSRFHCAIAMWKTSCRHNDAVNCKKKSKMCIYFYIWYNLFFW